MNIGRTMRQFERVITDNSPLILTSLGVVGTVATAFLTGKAAYQSAAVIKSAEAAQNAKREAGESRSTLTTQQQILKVWKLYIPAVGSGVLTCASIILAQHINARRMAVIAGGLALSRNDLQDYKEKVQNAVNGKKVHKDAKGSIIEEKIAGISDEEWDDAIYTGKGQVLFVDSYSMRPFYSSMDAVRHAEASILTQILKEGSATVSDWYDKLGLQHTAMSEDYGWNKDVAFEVEPVAKVVKEGRHQGEPCHMLVYDSGMILRPWSGKNRFRGDDDDFVPSDSGS